MSDHSHAQHFAKRSQKCLMCIRIVCLISVFTCVHAFIFSIFVKHVRYISGLQVRAHQDSVSLIDMLLLYPYMISI